MKKTGTLLVQFRIIIYITSEVNFMKKTETLLVQLSVLIYMASEINFSQYLRI